MTRTPRTAWSPEIARILRRLHYPLSQRMGRLSTS